MRSQKELVSKIYQQAPCDNEVYAKFYRPALERYARFVHLLPASESHHHRGLGGLFRHGLEVAFWSMQGADGTLFGLDKSPAERRRVRPCWDLAIFLAGIGHDIGKVVTDMVVTDITGAHTWSPFHVDLIVWARGKGIDHYYVRWRQDRQHQLHEIMTNTVANSLLTPEIKEYLATTAPASLEQLMMTLSGVMAGRNVIQEIVRKADRLSTEKDLREFRVEGGLGPQVAVPVERHLLDAMRRLVKDGSWKVNTSGGRVWYIAGKLYVVWRQGAKEITDLLAKDNLPAIPRDPDTLADILLERGLAIPWESDEGRRRYWRVAPHLLQKERQEKPVELACLLLKAPELIIDSQPASIPGDILTSRQEKLKPPVAEMPSVGNLKAQNKPSPLTASIELATAELICPPLGLALENLREENSNDLKDGSDSLARVNKRPQSNAVRPFAGDQCLPSDLGGPSHTANTPSKNVSPKTWDVLRALAKDLKVGRAEWGDMAILLPGHPSRVAIRYPQAIEAHGHHPRGFMAELAIMGKLHRLPTSPFRLVQSMEGFAGEAHRTNCLILDEETSQQFLVMTKLLNSMENSTD